MSKKLSDWEFFQHRNQNVPYPLILNEMTYFRGKYCASEGLQKPTGQCDAGYLCHGGSYTSTPLDGTRGGRF